MANTVDVIRIVQYFAGCSQPQANRAASAICRDPEALDLLLNAAVKCGVATVGVGAGGAITISGISPVSAPMIVIGLGVASLSAAKAAKFCTEMVELGSHTVPASTKGLLR
jgi:hypothetical protein